MQGPSNKRPLASLTPDRPLTDSRAPTRCNQPKRHVSRGFGLYVPSKYQKLRLELSACSSKMPSRKMEDQIGRRSIGRTTDYGAWQII